MAGNDRGAEGASGCPSNSPDAINSALRTAGDFPLTIEFNVGCQVVGEIDGFAVGFTLLQRELVGGSVNLPEVVDAGIEATGAAGFDEVGQRNNYDGDGNQNNYNPKIFAENGWLRLVHGKTWAGVTVVPREHVGLSPIFLNV